MKVLLIAIVAALAGVQLQYTNAETDEYTNGYRTGAIAAAKDIKDFDAGKTHLMNAQC